MLNPRDEGRVGRISALNDIINKVEVGFSNFLIGWGPGSSLAGGYLTDKGRRIEV